MVNTLVVGYGYWGQSLTTNLLAHPDFFVAGVHDPDADARRIARSRNLYAFAGLEDAINHTAPQVVVIASPIGTIVDTAIASLNRYAHVLMAKPGPTTIADAERVASLAMRRGRTAMVDYTMTMSSSLPRYVDRARRLGGLNNIMCVRDAIGARTTASVLDDLAVHDVSLICAAFPGIQWRVHFAEHATHHCHIVLRSNAAQASIHCRRDADKQRRVMRFIMDRGVVEWDQLGGDYDAGPVMNRLNLFRDRINSEPVVDDMMFKVTELLEAAR
jgi:predicted dehydrogenase